MPPVTIGGTLRTAGPLPKQTGGAANFLIGRGKTHEFIRQTVPRGVVGEPRVFNIKGCGFDARRAGRSFGQALQSLQS